MDNEYIFAGRLIVNVNDLNCIDRDTISSHRTLTDFENRVFSPVHLLV